MVIYLKHPSHGTKVAISREEADMDIANGWTEYTLDEYKEVVEQPKRGRPRKVTNGDNSADR